MASPDRILRQRDVTAMAALDTMPAIIDRVRNLLAHGRRISIARRYTYVDKPSEVTAGLTVDEVRSWTKADSAGIGVHLKPGLTAGFGISAYAGEADTEKEAWAAFHADTASPKELRNLTEVRIVGGLPDNGPARDDLIEIRAWNSHGVCEEYVIAFDYGPDREQQQEDLARHLWIADAGSPATWDGMADGSVKLAAYNTATGSKIRMEGADVRARFLAEADAILAVIAGKGG